MYTAADMMRIMQRQGEANNPPTIQLGTMTDFNACMIGDELALAPTQLYFFEDDLQRKARTVRNPSKASINTIDEGGESVHNSLDFGIGSKDEDRVVYTEPLKAGDLVALINMGDGRYLVLGRVVLGEKAIKETEQTDLDWSK